MLMSGLSCSPGRAIDAGNLSVTNFLKPLCRPIGTISDLTESCFSRHEASEIVATFEKISPTIFEKVESTVSNENPILEFSNASVCNDTEISSGSPLEIEFSDLSPENFEAAEAERPSHVPEMPPTPAVDHHAQVPDSDSWSTAAGRPARRGGSPAWELPVGNRFSVLSDLPTDDTPSVLRGGNAYRFNRVAEELHEHYRGQRRRKYEFLGYL